VNEDGEVTPMGTDRWAEALTWHHTLCETEEKELTSTLAREWGHWYADPENQRTFDDVSRLLADHGAYLKRPRPSSAELEADRYDLSVPIAKWRKPRAPHVTRKRRVSAGNRWRWLSGGFAVAAAAIAVLILWPMRFWSGTGPSGPVVYQTSVGELKHVQLRDGSTIVLGGRTQLSVAFSAQRRSVKLGEGQAWFKVAHRQHWPFVVAAGDGTITDVGTAFLVTRDSDRVVVTVTEGTVEVTAGLPTRPTLGTEQGVAPRPVLIPIRVTRGEQLAFSDNGTLSPVEQTDTRAATAWTRGRLTFDDQPLRYVVDTVDRYSSRHITVSPSAGALRFSGIVFDGEIGDWLRGLEKIFPVMVEQRGAEVRVQLRGSKPLNERPHK